MKRIILTGVILIISLITTNIQAQEVKEYEFTTVKELKITPVKNQSRSGTCWAFSGVGFIESELLRLGKGEYDLSEMFVVNKSYIDKADKYVRLHGFLNYAQGGSFHDVLYVFKHYGALPESIYKGLEYGDTIHIHGEMEASSEGFIKAIVTNPNGKLSSAWKKAHQGIIDTYLGKIPETFTYNGKEYTPESFGKSLGLNIDDYVSLTSYTHEPFYTQFALEIQDNWRWGTSYNLPLDELMQVFDNAVNSGYSVLWGADVSEKGFTRNGIAVIPDVEYIETKGSDQDHWVGLSRAERDKKISQLTDSPCKEIDVTQEMRQEAYDNYQTTDDHGMLIYGIANDQTGKKYYMVKNSWGTENKYKGTWYVSEAFTAYKTMNIVVHKNALTKAIKSKLGIK
ncbi:MAG: C1 family peptidase [Tannerella sp.]|jgi:aminopeptidase C|nr:C1 family peptidase [Tannerella sp.]